MKIVLFIASCLLAFCTQASATLVSVSNELSSAGDMAMIVAAPANVFDDGTTNTSLWGFDEMQDVTLGADLSVDGGTISAGTVIDSHMIFLNSQGNSLLTHQVTFTFAGTVLDVMSNTSGSLEAASNFLGAPGTMYPGAFANRGLENNDWYIISGNTITVNFRVTEPGDWIRVITAAEPVPEPATMTLLGVAGGLLGLKRRKRSKA